MNKAVFFEGENAIACGGRQFCKSCFIKMNKGQRRICRTVQLLVGGYDDKIHQAVVSASSKRIKIDGAGRSEIDLAAYILSGQNGIIEENIIQKIAIAEVNMLAGSQAQIIQKMRLQLLR